MSVKSIINTTLPNLGIMGQLGFWFKKVAAHPCCWLPLATGGSVQLFGAHNALLEIGVGVGLLTAIEEGSRFLKRHFSKASGMCPSCDVSRRASYSIALPLFLASYLAAHQLYPNHGVEHHDHAHQEVCRELKEMPDFTPEYMKSELEKHINKHHGPCLVNQ